MPRLPEPGNDKGTWGSILNDFLAVEHNADGTLKASASLAAKASLASLSPVATSGSYTDLLNKPTIPSAAPVQSVNTKVGTVVITPDDLNDAVTTNKFTSAAEKTKLSGVATGATLNDTDANLKNRANHTGTQTSATISDLTTTVNALIAAAPAPSTEQRFDILFAGTLTVQTNLVPLTSPGVTSISRIVLAAGSIPQGAPITVDVNVGGNTIFPTQSNRPTIASGASYSLKTVSYGPIAAGTAITVDVDTIGTTQPGGNLLVSIYVV
jgi:hypothetical protein